MKKEIKLLLLLFTSACTVNQNLVLPSHEPTISSVSSSTNSPDTSLSSIIISSPTLSAITTPVITSTPNSVLEEGIKKIEIFKYNPYIENTHKQLIDGTEPGASYDFGTDIKLYFQPNNYYNLSAKITYLDGSVSNDVTWKLSDESLAKIDNNGKLTTFYEIGPIEIILYSKKSKKEIFREKKALIGCFGGYGCLERSDVLGKVYDTNNNLLDGVTITIKSIDLNVDFNERSVTSNGFYRIRYAPVASRVEITASKHGYISKTIYDVLKNNINHSDDVNIYNFGGDNPEDKNLALEPIK